MPQANKILSGWKLHTDWIKRFENEGGYNNENWLVLCSNEKYVLRKVADFEPEQLLFDMRYVVRIKSRLPCEIPTPIKDMKGKYFEKHNGKVFWVYRYVEGEKRAAYGRRELLETARVIADYHRTVMRMHLHGKRNYDPFKVHEGTVHLRNDVKRMSRNRERRAFETAYLEWAKRLLPLYDSLDIKALRAMGSYPIHGDLNQDNVLWKGNRISAILDFEHLQKEKPLIHDLVVIIFRHCKDKRYPWKLDLGKAVLFLNAYSKLRRMRPEEIIGIVDGLISNYIADFYFVFRLVAKARSNKAARRDGTEYAIGLARSAL
jgi:homoserine kinase type II